MSFSHKARVGVLRGGPSPEYDVSLKTGSAILNNLPDDCTPLDIFISKEGIWHIDGAEKEPYKILNTIDLAINALHGSYGEDGTVQRILEDLGVPYTGSGQVSSAFGMNKLVSKESFRRAGLKIPHYMVVEKNTNEKADAKMMNGIFESMPFPLVIKPVNSGSSLGLTFIDRKGQLRDALKNAFEFSPKVLVEEYISGKEATCGVIEDFRGSPVYSLFPVEIEQTERRSRANPCLDYESKYKNPGSRYKVPGDWSEEEKKQIQETAALVHQILGLRHYSRSDFILHPKRGLFVLEANTLPELTHHSSFVKSLEAVGGTLKEFLSHLISKTLGRN